MSAIVNQTFTFDPAAPNTVDTTFYLTVNPPTSLVFGNGCVISWEKGKLEVSGDMSAGATLFFEHFLKANVDEYIRSIMPHDNLKYLEWCAEHKNER